MDKEKKYAPLAKGLILIVLFSIALSIMALVESNAKKKIQNKPEPAAVKKEDSFIGRIEEKITYNVSCGKVYLGRARFSRLANVKLKSAGRHLNVIVFETSLLRFSDKEKIYSDPQSFLPVRVERQIVNWFGREKIIEDYDQENFTLTIIKTKGKAAQKTVLKKEGQVHNAILLPFYLRRINELIPGWELAAILPNRKFLIKLVSLGEVSVPAGKFKAYYFESEPAHFKIWISADERRIPLKIEGLGSLGYSLAMKEYSP